MDVLSDETLSTEKEYELIIINDLNGTVEFTDNEIESLKTCMKRESKFVLFGNGAI